MKQQPADGAGDDGEECGNISLDQRADQNFDRDSHQEREYRAKQNDSRDNRELPGGEAAHAVAAVNTDLAIFSPVAVNNPSELPSPPGVSDKQARSPTAGLRPARGSASGHESRPVGVRMIYRMGVPSIRPRSSVRGASWCSKSSG
jgi:hypothetical protein